MSLKLIYAGLVVVLLTLATALRVADPTPIARLRLIVFDAYQQLWPRIYDPDLPVRVVLIDELSLKKFGQWPWPRSVLATLTKRLAENGAAVVGFDFVLAEPDRLLATELLKWLPSGPDAAALSEQIKQLPSGDVALADAIATVPSAMGFIGVDDGTALPLLTAASRLRATIRLCMCRRSAAPSPACRCCRRRAQGPERSIGFRNSIRSFADCPC